MELDADGSGFANRCQRGGGTRDEARSKYRQKNRGEEARFPANGRKDIQSGRGSGFLSWSRASPYIGHQSCETHTHSHESQLHLTVLTHSLLMTGYRVHCV